MNGLLTVKYSRDSETSSVLQISYSSLALSSEPPVLASTAIFQPADEQVEPARKDVHSVRVVKWAMLHGNNLAENRELLL